MRFVMAVLVLSAALTSAGCGGMSVYKARSGVLSWAAQHRYNEPGQGSGSTQVAADDVKNNTGPIVVDGIQELPQENAAKVDLTFDNFKYGDAGRERTYTGKGVAYFSRYNEGTWVLRKVSFGGREWDNIDIKVD